MTQNIIIRLMLMAVAAFPAMAAHAFDKKDYKEYANTIRQQIWSQNLPEFKNPQRTERFADKSEVVIAAYDEFVVTKKNSFNIFGDLYRRAELSSHVMMRRMVQINDKAALERYSSFDYLAFASRRVPYYGKMEVRKVLGVRVIKPDGTVREVSTDDYVVTSEGRKGKDERQKLAVPGLEVGDIIDLIAFRFTNAKDMAPEPMTFSFVSEFPMLSYRVHCEIDHNLPAHYRTLNGAPDFKVTTNDVNDYLLDVHVKDVEQTEPSLWYETAAQTPLTLLYVQIKTAIGNSTLTSRSAGLKENPHADVLQADDWNYWDSRQRFIALDKKDKTAVKEALEKFSTDEQRADYIYEHLYAYQLDRRVSGFSTADFILFLRSIFDKASILYQCGITTSEGREPIDELAYYGNTTWFLRLPGGKCYFAPSFACRPGELPYQLQGRKAVVCTNGKQKLTEGPYEDITLPQSEAKDNVDSVAMTASIEGTRLHIDRTRQLSGAQRQELSVYLPTRDELVRSVMESHDGKTHRDLYDGKYTAIIAEQNVEDRKIQKDIVQKELELFYGMAPAETGDSRVTSVGTTDARPTLSYQVSFVLDGLVKRAGQDLTLAIGKLLGQQLKIEGQERERTADIIREMPLSNKWGISISLPEGYTVDAAELKRLSTNVENVVGRFSTKLFLTDGKLYLKAEKTILHKREPVADWPLLLELYDQICDYTSRNIIIQRKE